MFLSPARYYCFTPVSDGDSPIHKFMRTHNNTLMLASFSPLREPPFCVEASEFVRRDHKWMICEVTFEIPLKPT